MGYETHRLDVTEQHKMFFLLFYLIILGNYSNVIELSINRIIEIRYRHTRSLLNVSYKESIVPKLWNGVWKRDKINYY